MVNNTQITIDENKIYSLKSIVRQHMFIRFLQWFPILIIIALMFAPLITVNLVITKVNVSIFDLMFKTSSSETLKGATACAITADFFNVPASEYKNYFNGLLYNFTKAFEQFNATSLLALLNFFISCFALFSIAIFIIISVSNIISAILNCNVEGKLRRTTAETFSTLFSHCFDLNGNLIKTPLSRSKTMVKFFISWLIGYLLLFGMFSYFFISWLFFLQKTEYVATNLLLPILTYVCLAVSLISTIIEYFYFLKNPALTSCKSLRNLVR